MSFHDHADHAHVNVIDKIDNNYVKWLPKRESGLTWGGPLVSVVFPIWIGSESVREALPTHGADLLPVRGVACGGSRCIHTEKVCRT